jgi:uncharacterized OB-fold protein
MAWPGRGEYVSAPAIDGWFTEGDAPALLGQRCVACGTTVFPPRAFTCPNPQCRSDDLERVELSRTGRVWSWATNHYAPPPPFVAPDPFEPFTVVAVELDDEGVTVLGQLDLDVDPTTLRVGTPVELTVGTLFEDDDGARTVFRFRPTEIRS